MFTGRPGRSLAGSGSPVMLPAALAGLWLEAVAHAGFGEQPARPGRVRLQLPPELGHVEPEVSCRVRVTRSPDLVQQLPLAEQLAGMPHEHLKQVPLGGRQPDVLPTPDDALGRQVDRQVPERHAWLARLRQAAAGCRAHPGQQLVHAERLGHVIVRAGVERLDLVVAVGAARQHDDRRVGPAAQPADHFDAIQVGQAEVEYYQVGRVLRSLVERLRAGLRGVDLVIPGAQVYPERPDDLRLVVNDEHPAHDGTWSALSGWVCSPGRVRAVPGTAGSESSMVRPPPGVSSGSKVPSIASVRPFDNARPRPMPVVLSVSPSRWNGTNIRPACSLGMPGPRSMTRNSTRSPNELAVSSGGVPAGQ